nr:MAG TPA: hypothetical protein [Inoviridae sp.]
MLSRLTSRPKQRNEHRRCSKFGGDYDSPL